MKFWKGIIFRRVLCALLLAGMLIALDTGIGELLRPVSYSTSFTHDLRQIEKSGETVDYVFIGASRTMRTFVPQVLEDELGLSCVINAGSSSQPISSSYYEMKDLIERFHPSRVFLGVTWNWLRGFTSLQGRLIVYDRLSLPNQIAMAAQAFAFSEWPYLSAVYRFKDNFISSEMREYMEDKQRLAELDFAPELTGKQYYYDTGFIYNANSIPQGNVAVDTFRGYAGEADRHQENMEYLDACVALCREHGVRLTLISGVTSMMRLYAIGNYQGAVDFYSAYAEENGLEYYNLNYLLDRESLVPDTLMGDDNHVNGEGAFVVTKKLAQVLAAEEAGEDVSAFFYEDLEALKQDTHRIVAAGAEIDRLGNHQYDISLTSLQNEDVAPLYRVLLRLPGEEEFQLIQDWSPNTQLHLAVEAGEKFTVRVEAGAEDETIGIAWQEYSVKPKK